MKKDFIKKLIEDYAEGKISLEDFVFEISTRSIVEGLNVKIDGLRELRKGYPETVFCLNKTPEQAREAFIKIYEKTGRVLGTKANKEQYLAVQSAIDGVRFYELSGVLVIDENPPEKIGYVPVIGAGASDYPVCEEAFLALEFFGSRSKIITDVGVAGIHRLEKIIEDIKEANCLIVVAGMEGALASLIAGISPVPVVGVPVSTGYGTSFGGLTALFSMLNSCAEGLAVVNIDNGLGAATFAHTVNRLCRR